jgi:hypothetical protein
MTEIDQSAFLPLVKVTSRRTEQPTSFFFIYRWNLDHRVMNNVIKESDEAARES